MHIAILLARLPAPTAMIRTHSFLFVFDFFGVCFRILLACVSFAAPLLKRQSRLPIRSLHGHGFPTASRQIRVSSGYATGYA